MSKIFRSQDSQFVIDGNVEITGNFNVQGTTTTNSASNLVVNDPRAILAANNVTDSIDIGIIGIRASDNVAMFWDEDADEFVVAFTTDGASVGSNIAISQYAAFHSESLLSNSLLQVGPSILYASTVNSNVGIGTTSPDPTKALHVVGNTLISGDVTVSGILTATIAGFDDSVHNLVGNMVFGNVQNGISVTYDSIGKKLNFDVDDFTLSMSGDVTGSNTITNLANTSISLNITNDSVSNVKLADMPSLTIKGNNTLSSGDPIDLTTSQVKSMLSLTIADVSNLQLALDGKADLGHIHDASAITTGTLAVARGGTGISSYTTNNYIRASGSTALEQRTPAQVLLDINGVDRSGDTMTGFLTLNANPTASLHAATKQYVDSAVAGSGGSAVWGGITGTLSNQTDLQFALDAKANAVHSHTTTDIISGTFSIARGGTGLSSLGTASQILGVNSGATALEYKTISGTTNQVNILQGTGTITLSTPQDIHSTATPTFSRLILSQTTGTAPMTVSSTTVVTNLNADLLDGLHASSFALLTGATFTGAVVAPSFNTTSTIRYKTDVTDLDDDRFDKLRPVSWKWNDKMQHLEGKTEFGFIAEEMYEIYPELVSIDEYGLPSGIDYAKLTAILTLKLKSQEKIIKQMQEEFEQLKKGP